MYIIIEGINKVILSLCYVHIRAHFGVFIASRLRRSPRVQMDDILTNLIYYLYRTVTIACIGNSKTDFTLYRNTKHVLSNFLIHFYNRIHSYSQDKDRRLRLPSSTSCLNGLLLKNINECTIVVE